VVSDLLLDYTAYPGWELFHYGAYTTDAGVTWISTEGAPAPQPFHFEISGTVLPEAFPALSVSDGGCSGRRPWDEWAGVFQCAFHAQACCRFRVDFRTVAAWLTRMRSIRLPATVTFPPGTTNQTITITVTGDSGTNQTFRLHLSNPTTPCSRTSRLSARSSPILRCRSVGFVVVGQGKQRPQPESSGPGATEPAQHGPRERTVLHGGLTAIPGRIS